MDNQSPPNQFKILSYPQRLAILRCLMSGPATLSQLGGRFNVSPAHIRHHLKVLETAGLVEFLPGHPSQNHLERYYRATQEALVLNLAVLPEVPDDRPAILLSSKDRATRVLAHYFSRPSFGFSLQIVPFNSLDGLVALRQGISQMSTCHLLDEETGVYNRPFVRHLFPGQAMTIIQLYHREEGIMVRPGNPLQIRRLEDLARAQVRFINRELGSGIRIWFDKQLRDLEIPIQRIYGYENTVHSHGEVAKAVLEGRADAGLGIAASALEAGLDFIPLFAEPYELVLPRPLMADQRYAAFFDYLNSGQFRTAIHQLDGYQVASTAGQAETIS